MTTASQSAKTEVVGKIKELSMPQPATSELQPWTSFPKMEYNFIEDDFVDEAPVTIKANLGHCRGGVELEQRVEEKGDGKLHIVDETKFWIGLPDKRSLYARLRSHDNIKLHYDNGTRKLFGKQFNFYATLSAAHNFVNPCWKFGLSHSCSKMNSDCRLKINDGSINSGSSFSTRNVFKNGKFTFGFVGMVRLDVGVLACSNLLLGYEVDRKTNVFLRVENEHFRRKHPEGIKGWFDHFAIDAVSRYDKNTTVAAEIALQSRSNAFKWTQLVLERTLKQNVTSKMKIKASSGSFQFSATTRMPLFTSPNQAFLSVGVHSLNPHKDGRQFRWGTQVQFNL